MLLISDIKLISFPDWTFRYAPISSGHKTDAVPHTGKADQVTHLTYQFIKHD